MCQRHIASRHRLLVPHHWLSSAGWETIGAVYSCDALCLLLDYGSDLLASSSLILSAFGMPNYMKLSRMFIICLLSAPPWRLTGSPSLSCNQSAILIQSECDSSILTVDPGEVIYGFDAIHVQEVIDGRW